LEKAVLFVIGVVLKLDIYKKIRSNGDPSASLRMTTRGWKLLKYNARIAEEEVIIVILSEAEGSPL